VYQTATLERWYKKLSTAEKKKLRLTKAYLMQHRAEEITVEVYPAHLELQGLKLNLSYHFEPGSPRDGVTLEIPLFHLNQIEAPPLEWLVLGLLKEKVEALLRSLPLRLRRPFVPIPDYAQGFFERWFDAAQAPQQKIGRASCRERA